MKSSIHSKPCPEDKHSDEEIIEDFAKLLWSLIESKRGSDASWMQNSFHEPATFCPARAIIQKNKIVVLDEVSSSIDVATDKVVQRVVREAFAGATIGVFTLLQSKTRLSR
ncbi:hypothetical protein V1508DRAFT_428697 [Lipomyces doorenjongii]|uniref:uncharacterized protein n=1 Tax=Lipomyces doorenjongii TaxID=383834 RepID=UPI0034CF26FD